MGRYLNSIMPYDNYKTMANGRYFVDKSEIIGDLIPYINDSGRYLCVKRPRRFGKTVMANLIAAFFLMLMTAAIFLTSLKYPRIPITRSI